MVKIILKKQGSEAELHELLVARGFHYHTSFYASKKIGGTTRMMYSKRTRLIYINNTTRETAELRWIHRHKESRKQTFKGHYLGWNATGADTWEMRIWRD